MGPIATELVRSPPGLARVVVLILQVVFPVSCLIGGIVLGLETGGPRGIDDDVWVAFPMIGCCVAGLIGGGLAARAILARLNRGPLAELAAFDAWASERGLARSLTWSADLDLATHPIAVVGRHSTLRGHEGSVRGQTVAIVVHVTGQHRSPSWRTTVATVVAAKVGADFAPTVLRERRRPGPLGRAIGVARRTVNAPDLDARWAVTSTDDARAARILNAAVLKRLSDLGDCSGVVLWDGDIIARVIPGDVADIAQLEEALTLVVDLAGVATGFADGEGAVEGAGGAAPVAPPAAARQPASSTLMWQRSRMGRQAEADDVHIGAVFMIASLVGFVGGLYGSAWLFQSGYPQWGLALLVADFLSIRFAHKFAGAVARMRKAMSQRTASAQEYRRDRGPL